MLKLKNLQKNESQIGADFYPEDSTQAGHITVSLKTGQILTRIDPEGYKNSFSYVAHARQALLKLAEQDILPEEYNVMWY